MHVRYCTIECAIRKHGHRKICQHKRYRVSKSVFSFIRLISMENVDLVSYKQLCMLDTAQLNML